MGEGRKKEERNINVWLPFVRPLLGTCLATQACALIGNGTCDPFALQSRVQSTRAECEHFTSNVCLLVTVYE